MRKTSMSCGGLRKIYESDNAVKVISRTSREAWVLLH